MSKNLGQNWKKKSYNIDISYYLTSEHETDIEPELKSMVELFKSCKDMILTLTLKQRCNLIENLGN